MPKSFVIITNGNFFASRILSSFLEQYPHDSAVLIINGDYKGRGGIAALRAFAQTTTLPYLIFKIVSTYFLRIVQIFYPNLDLSVKKAARKRGIPYLEIPSVRAPEALSWVQAYQPELIISVSCPQLIGKKLLSSARLGGINIHSSLLPAYAGLAPYYWVLSNGEMQTGITVHWMSLMFDTGNILAQRRVAVEPRESAFHLFWRLAEIGKLTLDEGVGLAIHGSPGQSQDLLGYTYYSNPTLDSYWALRHQEHTLMTLKDLLSIVRSPMMPVSQLGEIQSIEMAHPV